MSAYLHPFRFGLQLQTNERSTRKTTRWQQAHWAPLRRRLAGSFFLLVRVRKRILLLAWRKNKYTVIRASSLEASIMVFGESFTTQANYSGFTALEPSVWCVCVWGESITTQQTNLAPGVSSSIADEGIGIWQGYGLGRQVLGSVSCGSRPLRYSPRPPSSALFFGLGLRIL